MNNPTLFRPLMLTIFDAAAWNFNINEVKGPHVEMILVPFSRMSRLDNSFFPSLGPSIMSARAMERSEAVTGTSSFNVKGRLDYPGLKPRIQYAVIFKIPAPRQAIPTAFKPGFEYSIS